MQPRTSLRALFALPLLLGGIAGCSAAGSDEARDVREDVHHGRFDQAVREAARLSQAHPDDAALAELHRQASVAWLLEQGRRATFLDKDAEALSSFRQAQELDPGSKEAGDWIQKTVRKLSRT